MSVRLVPIRLLWRAQSVSAVARLGMSSSSSTHDVHPIKNVTVIGSGLMGAGIAQVSAQSKLNVVLVDQSDEILGKAKKNFEKSLQRVAKKMFPDDQKGSDAFVFDTMARLTLTTNIKEAVSKADLVVEAIVENLAVKQRLFAEVESAAPGHAILTTNTSSLTLADIAQNVAAKDRFGGLHFFNPVPVMKLLEVVRLPETSEETNAALFEYGKKVGKTTVASKDTPGFIVNRLLVPYMMEALRMAERGDATVKDIDTAMKLGAGYPMGPFELCDYVGIDTTKFIMDGWHKKFPNDALFQPSAWMDKLVLEGKLGRKTGEGFYKY